MKMQKAITAVVAVLFMLCNALPLSALADGLHIDTLTFLKVYAEAPMAGREADFDVGVGALPTNAARVYVEQKDNLHYHRGVGWYDYTDGRYLEEGELFVAGHAYTVHVAVYVQNYFYQFSSSLEATVNGEPAVVTNGYASKAVVTYDFGVCKNPPPDIAEVAVGGNLRPVAGEAPVFTLAYDHERMEIDPYAGTAFINGVAWYNSNTYSILDETDTFKAGETYTMEIQLRAKDPYRFATEGGESAVNATVEGIEAVNISAQEEDQSRYLKLRTKFTCADTDVLGGGADRIGLNIPYPVAGKKASYAPTLYGENCEYAPVTANGFYDGVKWVNRTNHFTCNSNSVFNEGADYSVTVLVKAKSIFQDSTRLCYLLHEDGTVDPYIRATVNGLPARVEPYGDQSPAQIVQVTFDFPACNSTSRTIEDITFTDIRTPVVGNKVDTVATVEYGYKEDIPAAKESVDLTWLRISENESEIRELTVNDVFEEGYLYAWVVGVSADSLSDFSTDEQPLNVSVRGAVQTNFQPVSSKQIQVAALYIPLASLPDPINRIDVIGAVAPSVGQRPYADASLTEALMPYATVTGVTWIENGHTMAENTTFRKGNTYSAVYTVEAAEPYTFAQTAVIRGSVNGNETLYNGYDGSTGLNIVVSDDGCTASVLWAYGELGEASYTGVTDYAEIGELMRPAPGQAPDFNVTISSPYTQFGGVTWYELDDNGYRIASLSYEECFKKNTVYRVEIRLLPSAGRSINLDSRGAVLNGEFAQYYYLTDEAAVVYAEYDTASCITDIEIVDVQYPIGGKTPDSDAVVKTDLVNYTGLEWYYETNPGTAGAGFSRLDGKFKSDRRHQVYATLETYDGGWFATDNEGTLAVNVTVDGVPASFVYSTDSNTDDGAVNTVEAARTFELAKNVDGVFVGGMWLRDGLYLDSDHWGVRTEDTVDKDAGYAYYKDGVLTLHDFTWTAQGDYNMVDAYHPLTIKTELSSTLTSPNANGIVTGSSLTLEGDGDLTLITNGEGIFATGDVTVNSGTVVVKDNKYDGLWLYKSLTVNGGTLDVYGPQCGINGDDYPPVTVNGGTLIARTPIDYAIAWCDVSIADGATVTVSEYGSDAMTPWDGTTGFDEYDYVEITVGTAALLGDMNGDGMLNTMDALLLFGCVNGAREMTAEQEAIADYTGDGTINMMDALRLFKTVSGS
ncbi:MAG: carbohydrate-binding domain-containing protein [Clostridia bacterium]|nr:carbohydrate-binding domain-containing protein [Clostridia bacterium]